jgi:hypothetical protein
LFRVRITTAEGVDVGALVAAVAACCSYGFQSACERPSADGGDGHAEHVRYFSRFEQVNVVNMGLREHRE